MIKKRIKAALFVFVSFAAGFLLSSVMSMYANRLYSRELLLSIIHEHQQAGMDNMENGSLEDAVCHFSSMMHFSLDENFHHEFNKELANWTLFFPVIAAPLGYIIADLNLNDDYFGVTNGTAMAYYAYALEQNGDKAKAVEKYQEALELFRAAGINRLEDIDSARYIAKSTIEAWPEIKKRAAEGRLAPDSASSVGASEVSHPRSPTGD